MSISIKFPFQETQEGGVFLSTKTTAESIQSNLISLLTTKRRNRVMNNSLYSPLWDYMFEPWDDISASNLKEELIEKIGEYITEVSVVDVLFNFNETENLLEVKIVYKIPSIGIKDSINVSVPVEPGGDSDNNQQF